jgi:Pla-1/cef family extracellular lipase
MPRKKILASLIISSFVLTACDSDSNSDNFDESLMPGDKSSRIQFSPKEGIVSLPNDLLFSGTTDGTLELPDETAAIAAASAAGGTMTYADNTYAIGALDGWSTTQPISIGVELFGDRTLDAASIAQPGAVRIFPVGLGGPLSTSPTPACKGYPSLTVCEIDRTDELVYGTHFITKASGNSIAVVPLIPFAEKSSYIYLTTDLIQDSSGQAVKGSFTYDLLKKDFATNPIGDPANPDDAAAVQLQTLFNHYDNQILTPLGIDASSVTLTGVFTTQSNTDVINTLKGAIYFSATGTTAYDAYAPSSPSIVLDTTLSVAMALGIDNTDDRFDSSTATSLYSSTIDLPYYLDYTSTTSHWTAKGDSPLTILGAYAAAPTAILNLLSSVCPTADVDIPSTLVGCEAGLDDFNHLTRYNPLPAIPLSTETVNVQITVPDSAKPLGGWPVNIAVHGLGTHKGTTLANAGYLAEQGIATIAIDMPLHGSRGFDLLNSDGVYEISATDSSFGAPYANGTPLAFININSGLTVRDNFRQAVVDLLALRTKIEEFTDPAGGLLFNKDEVSAHGLSLGAITATSLTAYANDITLSAFYGLKTTSLVAPTGGLADTFNDSAEFGPMLMDELIKVVSVTQGNSENEAAAIVANRTSATYIALESYVDENIIPSLLFSIQTQVDPIDPINFASTLKVQITNDQTKLHIIEIIGDGADNLSDQVLPNGNGLTLTGTTKLISLLGLGCVDETTTTDVNTSGAIKFLKGHHSSLIKTTPSAGASTAGAIAASLEMQTQVATFAYSASANGLTVTNSDVDSDGSGNDLIDPCS